MDPWFDCRIASLVRLAAFFVHSCFPHNFVREFALSSTAIGSFDARPTTLLFLCRSVFDLLFVICLGFPAAVAIMPLDVRFCIRCSPHNHALLWTDPRRGGSILKVRRSQARRVVGHRTLSVMWSPAERIAGSIGSARSIAVRAVSDGYARPTICSWPCRSEFDLLWHVICLGFPAAVAIMPLDVRFCIRCSPHNHALLWTDPRRDVTILKLLRSLARRVVGHRTLSVMWTSAESHRWFDWLLLTFNDIRAFHHARPTSLLFLCRSVFDLLSVICLGFPAAVAIMSLDVRFCIRFSPHNHALLWTDPRRGGSYLESPAIPGASRCRPQNAVRCMSRGWYGFRPGANESEDGPVDSGLTAYAICRTHRRSGSRGAWWPLNERDSASCAAPELVPEGSTLDLQRRSSFSPKVRMTATRYRPT